MSQTITAIYDELHEADAAVRELIDSGFDAEETSLITRDPDERYRQYLQVLAEQEDEVDEEEAEEVIGEGAEMGAEWGGVIGSLAGILAGVGFWFFPPIGPFLAAGPLASVIGGIVGAGAGAAAGGAVGGLVGALTEIGVKKEHAGRLAEAIRRGSTLVIVHAQDDEPRARAILDRHHPVDIEERVDLWREEGWSGYDPEAEKYPHPIYSAHPVKVQASDVEGNPAYAQGYAAFDAAYRGHYAANLENSGHTYLYYLPGYAYGYQMAIDERFRGRPWSEVKEEGRAIWERETREGDWNSFEPAMHFAYQHTHKIWEERKLPPAAMDDAPANDYYSSVRAEDVEGADLPSTPDRQDTIA